MVRCGGEGLGRRWGRGIGRFHADGCIIIDAFDHRGHWNAIVLHRYPKPQNSVIRAVRVSVAPERL